MDSVVEEILKEIIPNYTNDLLRADGEVTESSYNVDTTQEPSKVSGMEFRLTKESEKSDFQRELAKHFDMIKDLMGEKKEDLDDSNDSD